jgi:hypothetical protein
MHRSRIKHITWWNNKNFITDNPFISESQSQANSILLYLSPLANLETIIGFATETHRLLEQGTPIQCVYSDSLSMRTLSLPVAHHLRHFETTETLQAILPLTPNLPNVQDIIFIEDGVSPFPAQPAIEIEEFDGRMPASLSWTSLSYKQSARHFPLWLLDKIPRLRRVDLTLSFQKVGEFFTKCNHLSCLKDVTINFTFAEEPSNLPSKIPPCLSIHNLSFTCMEGQHLELASHFQQLYRLLVKALVNIRSLSLYGTAV